MAVNTIHFPAPYDEVNPPGITLGDTTWVGVRSTWSSEWQTADNLIPTEVTWSVSPTLPIATLEAYYGDVMQPWEHQFQEVTRSSITDLVGQYIHIWCTTQLAENVAGGGSAGTSLTRDWFGIIEEAHDEQGGINPKTGRMYGRVTLVAYGMEKLLSDHAILDSVCEDYNGFDILSGIALDFNRAGPRGVKGNRSTAKVAGSYVFSGNSATAEKWSSYDIMEYLIQHQTPKDHAGVKSVPFRLSLPPELPPNSDAPAIKAENATTYSIISQLLDRRRATMWWCEVDTDTNSVLIKADTMVRSPVVGNKISIPANSRQINLQYDTDPLTNVVVNNSSLPRFDQVVAQGPRIRCVGSFQYADGNIEAAWKAADETAYKAGGTPHPAGTPIRRKQLRNETARRSPTLESVYSLFQIPDDWNLKVGTTPSDVPLFVDDDGNLRDQCTPELIIEQSMPLLEGVDYSGTLIEAGGVPTSYGSDEEMRPFVMLRRPTVTASPYKWKNAEGSEAGLELTNPKDNPRLSCNVSIPQNSKTIKVQVQGQPQHAIAYGDFTKITNEDHDFGQYTWKNAIFTLSVLSQDRTEGRWPELLTQGDAVRRKVIYAGDQYFRDYVAPLTVVGLDSDGDLVHSTTGGHIPAKGGASDPTKQLVDIAKIAAAWYTVQHYVLSLDSYRLKSPSDIPLGALIYKAGGDPQTEDGLEVNAPVTQITYLYPHEKSEKVKPARMTIKTWAGELDAVEFMAVKPPSFVDIGGRRVMRSDMTRAADAISRD
jgi:hypothetical protein